MRFRYLLGQVLGRISHEKEISEKSTSTAYNVLPIALFPPLPASTYHITIKCLLIDRAKTTVGKSAHIIEQSSFTKGHALTVFSKVFFCPGQIVIRLHQNKKIGSFCLSLSIDPGYCCIVVKQFFHKISIALKKWTNGMY